MLAFLIYLPTVAYVPHVLYILIFFYLIFLKMLEKKTINFTIDGNVKILLVILFLVLINRLIFIENHIFVLEKETILNFIIPSFIMVFLSYFIALNLKKNDLNILLILILIEAVVTILEFYYGKTTFFTGLNRFKEANVDGNELLYFFRPMGLSENSSILAVKLFIGLVVLYFNREYFNKKVQVLFYILLIIALVFSFNRTAFISIFIFYFLFLIKYYAFPSKSIKDKIIKLLIGIFVIISTIYFINIYGDEVYLQLTRGGNTDVLTGRGAIWQSFGSFIGNHILFGNGSYKLYLPFYHGGWGFAHAHNSYLEFLATNGIIIFILYLFIIFRNINRYNFIYLISFLIFSLTQYFLFWGISIQDILFFYFLTLNKRKFFEKH